MFLAPSWNDEGKPKHRVTHKMELPFTTLDVFTNTPFKGNPLAIVTVSSTSSKVLSQTQKQSIAREFNLSETVFVHESDDPRATDRRIDIFTPTQELPFAGHPVIGTAVFLRPRGISSLSLKAGPVSIDSTDSETVRVAIPHNVRLHARRIPHSLKGRASDAPQRLIDAETGAPIFSIVNGMAFILIELPSLEDLAMAQIGIMGLAPSELLDEGWSTGWISRRYYYVKMGVERVDGRSVHKLRARMIRPAMEDPATGSAACCLASYLSLHVITGDDEIGFDITQGVEMGRESHIRVDASVGRSSDESKELKSLHLGGTAVEVMSGVLRLP